MVEKNISIKIEETKEKLANIINECDLQPCIIKLIIDGISKEVTTLAANELTTDIKKYKIEREAEQEARDAQMAADIQPKAKAKAKTVPVDDKIDLQDK